VKVLAISGSARARGNTELLLSKALEPLAAAGYECEVVGLHDKTIQPCTACRQCATEEGRGRCVIDDDFGPVYEKMVAADALLVGSPVYFGSASPNVMALLDRAGYIAYNGGDNPFRRKVGAALVVARRAGVNFTLAQLMFVFLILGMVVPGSTYWPIAYGRDRGEVAADAEGLRTAEELGRNMAWLLGKLRG
jgi:multimeric flavodoxin WrbA